jgi:Xaa-Pro aminopeptidase
LPAVSGILVNMRVFVGLLIALSSLFADGISRDEYRSRRAELRKSLDGVMVLFGANESDDLRIPYLQETNFLYLSGWKEPGAVMMLTRNEDILFLPERSRHEEIFFGHRLAPEDSDATEKSGFDKVMPYLSIETEFTRLLRTAHRVYALSGDPNAEKLKPLAPFHGDPWPAQSLIAELRVMKSPAEIELITKAADATVAAHLAAWKMIKPGEYEYQVSAVMQGVYFSKGCEGYAYQPIVGSGPNSVILHYSANRRRADSGEVLLMDVGAECSDYAMDVTRTVPVNGKFTPRQREIYQIVLGAQQAAIAAVKPGAKMRGKGSLTELVQKYFDSHGKDLHGDPLGKYFVHGLGHPVGLDVHDPGDTSTLKAGMVITIEPGLYIPEENIGVRIEDTLLVTESGSKNLSGALPRDPDEIERLVGK